MELSSDGRPCEEGVLSLKYGLESSGSYTHSSKHCNILSVTFNSKTSQYIILDSRGITGWFRNSTLNYTARLHNFGSYKFNLLRDIIYCRSANVYFGLSKDFGVKVYNLNFIEIFSIATEGTTISRLLFDWKRSELIMISRNKFQFWKFMIVEKSRACEGLKLQREYDVPEGALVTNAEYDCDSGRLYLVCDHDIWCYDVFGQCVAHFVHSRFVLSTLAVCALCTQANVLIAGSSTGEIPIYSLNGGLITTLLNHTRIITALIAHPSDGTLFLSSSMDGTIKIFSLQMFEEVYSISVYGDGIHWMKLRSTNTLFCASTSTISLFDLNHVCSFWGTVRSSVKSIDVVPKYGHKTSHILVYGEDKCIRIFSRKSGQKKCTVLPPPEYVGYKDNLSFSYDRVGNIIYVLFNEEQLWIYLTRTDPATRVAVWNVHEIVKMKLHDLISFVVGYSSSEMPVAKDFGCGSYNERKEEEKVRCLCTETIARDLYRQRFQLSDSHDFSLLMCGMSNGIVYFLDPSPPVSVVMGFRAHPTSPILKLQTVYQGTNTLLMTMIQTINETLLKIWNYDTFALVHTLTVGPDVLIFSLKFTIFVSGTSSGQLRIVRLEGIGSDSQEDLTSKGNVEHNGPIIDVDVLEHQKIICSCSSDQYVRLWNYQKDLLFEINFDETLCCAAFLGSKGSLLIGLKLHLFTVSYEMLKFQSGDEYDSDESDNESLVYEDPLVRQDLGKNLEFKTRNLENYLIPYPYLSLESKWMEQAAISDDIEGSNKDISSASSRCSSTSMERNAPTEVYADSLCSEFSILDYDIEMPRCNADSPGFDDDSRCGSCNELWSEIEISIPVENTKDDLSAKVLFQADPEIKDAKVKETELKKVDTKSVVMESKPKPKPFEKPKISSQAAKPEVKKPGNLVQPQLARRSKKEKVVEKKKSTVNQKTSPPKSKATKKIKSSVATKPASKKVRRQAKGTIDTPATMHDASMQSSPKRTDAVISVPSTLKHLGKAEIVKNELPAATVKGESCMFVESNLNKAESDTVNQSDSTSPSAVKSLIPVHSLGRMRDVVSKLGVCSNDAELKGKSRIHTASYRNVLNSLVNEGVPKEEEGESVVERVTASQGKLPVPLCRKSSTDLVTDTALESMGKSISENLNIEDVQKIEDSGNTKSLTIVVNIDQEEGNDALKSMSSQDNSQKNVSFQNDARARHTSAHSGDVLEGTKKSGWDYVRKGKRKKSVVEGLQYRSNMSDWERSRVAIMALNRIKHNSQNKKSDMTGLTDEVTKSSLVSVPRTLDYSNENPITHVEDDKIDEHLVTGHKDRLPRKNEKPKYLLAGKVKPIIGEKRWANLTKTSSTASCNVTNRQKNSQNGYLVKLMRSLRMSSVLSHSYDENLPEETSAAEYAQITDNPAGDGGDSEREEMGLKMNILDVNGVDSGPDTPVHKVTNEYDRRDDIVVEDEDPDRLAVPDQVYMSSSTSNERSEVSFFLSREEMSSGMERFGSTILDDLMCLTPDLVTSVEDNSFYSFPRSNDDILKGNVGIDGPVKQRKIAFDESHLLQQRMQSSLSSGYGTRSPCSIISYYEKPSRPKSDDDLFKCSRQKTKKRLSVDHSPSQVEYQSSLHQHQSNLPNSGVDKQQMKRKEMPKGERNEQIRKLEHKMSGQPYRLHCVKSSSDYQNEMTKLMFMKSADMGREFLRYSQRRVISIPSKKDCPGAYRERIEEYSY